MRTRRKLLIAFFGVFAAPLATLAQQQGKVWRVVYLSQFERLDSARPDPFTAFQQGMRELGYVEGSNLVIERRHAEGSNERLSALATELVNLKVDVFITSNTPVASALQRATAAIPIVIINIGDPVGAGLVKSLARPGGNITGLSNLSADIAPKRLEMLVAMVPRLSRVAVLVDPSNLSNIKGLEALQSAALKRGVKILRAEVRTAQDIDNAFSLMARDRAQAFIVFQGQIFTQQRRRIAGLAEKTGLPSISGDPEYAEVGGLMRYGASVADQFRRAATFVDKISKGARPGDLAVELPTKFELVINRKTAKALGLTIPQSLLVSADKVIE